mgnify:CR=1 FL=1
MAKEKVVKPDIWMPLYVSDYLGDTMHLNTEQHGAYLLLLMAAWRNGGSLANDKSVLQTITRLDAKRWQSTSQIIAKFFYVTQEEWIHNRVKRELNKAKSNSEKRAECGKKGAAKRWQNDSKAIANAIANAYQIDGPSPSPNLPTVVIGKPAGHDPKCLGKVDAETGEVVWAN